MRSPPQDPPYEKAHRAKTKEKFEIVQLILPRIAEKSAKIVNKKIPILDATITKIMGVVWIDETIAYDKKQKRHNVTINVHNFTSAGKKLNIHLLLPRGLEAKSMDPKPAEIRDDGKQVQKEQHETEHGGRFARPERRASEAIDAAQK